MKKLYHPYENFLTDTKVSAQKIEWEFDAIIAIAEEDFL